MITVLVGGACTLAEPEQAEVVVPISNILVEGTRGRGGGVDDNLRCIAIDYACGLYLKKDCCTDSVCKISIIPGRVTGTCQKCPVRGDFCSLFRHCCSDYTCDGLLWGRCS